MPCLIRSPPAYPISVTIYSRRGLHGQVFDTLGRRIVTGEFPEGAILDVEGLETEFRVSRTVVRETLRGLATKGLLDARPRVGTFVLPRHQWNLLDTDVMRWRGDAGPSVRLQSELDELRRLIEPWASRRAATNRTDDDVAELHHQVDLMRRSHEIATRDGSPSALPAHIDADLAFHSTILRATGNELADRLVVVLEPLLRSRNELIPETAQSAVFLELHAAVAAAIEAGDPDEAERTTTSLLDQAASDLSAVSPEQV